MKRRRTTSTTYTNAPFKRPRQNTAPIYRNPKVYPKRRRSQAYVARTPGGQVVAENQYFDCQTIQASVTIANVAAVGDWSTTRISGYTGVTGTVNMSTLFVPTEGNDISNRFGRRVFVKKIRLNGTLSVPTQASQATGDDGAVIRVILVQDKQTNGAALTGDQVIGSGYQNPEIDMFQNTANFGRFKILKDKSFVLQNMALANNAAATGNLMQQGLKRQFKMSCYPNCHVNFNSTNGGTIADIIDNSFHILAATDTAGAMPTIQFKARIVFTP